jgi:hypothetical protein
VPSEVFADDGIGHTYGLDAIPHKTSPDVDFPELTIAMSPTGKTFFDLETELLIKSQDYFWGSIVAFLNIPRVMKDIR